MGLGWDTAYGFMGAQTALDTLRNQLLMRAKQEQAQKQQQFENDLQLRGANRADRQQQQQADQFAQTLGLKKDEMATEQQKYAEGAPMRAAELRMKTSQADALDRKPQDEQATRDFELQKLGLQNTNELGQIDARTRGQLRVVGAQHAGQGKFQVQQVYGPDGKPGGVVRINAQTGEVQPMNLGGTVKPDPMALNEAKTQASKTEALNSLDQVDKALDEAKNLIGPGAGRYQSILQMVGAPDPRIQALGTKLMMAKMQVDHSLGGARAAASPNLLARWDNILGQQMDHAGMKASIQAMREILGGQANASGGGVPMIAPDGRRLMVPAEKVAELEAKGAKRGN